MTVELNVIICGAGAVPVGVARAFDVDLNDQQ